ncbi:MAG TPA: helix-turn-helix transcriptional regulator [Thermoanaerobaculia bacterium]|nr:helix-turn-helix transcriptional regulator [Thermoanaerobaculia bacterium]
MKQGEVLMKEREKKKLSLEDLAEKMGMPVERYREIEAGDSPAEKWGPTIRDLAVALEVPTSRMFATTGKVADTKHGQAAELIRKHREAKGLSVEAMAEKAGLSVEEYQEIESGSSGIEEWGPFFLRFAAEVLDPHFPGVVFNLFLPFGLKFEQLAVTDYT